MKAQSAMGENHSTFPKNKDSTQLKANERLIIIFFGIALSLFICNHFIKMEPKMWTILICKAINPTFWLKQQYILDNSMEVQLLQPLWDQILLRFKDYYD